MPNEPIRVLICSDVGNEADDQFAIVHALLTPRIIVKGLIAGFFNEARSTEKSYKKMLEIALLTRTNNSYPIVKGASKPLKDYNNSAGADLIISEALSNNKNPLFVICLGGLTDLAIALRKNRLIAKYMTVIWVGGGRYPKGSHEANLARDLEAANTVMESPCELWQIPSNAYKQMRVSVSFLKWQLGNTSPIGEYLCKQIDDFSNKHQIDKPWINTESWILGDSSAIGVILDEQKGNYHMQVAPRFNQDFTYDLFSNTHIRPIRVYSKVDRTLVLSDLIAKIKLRQINI